jgi:tRNA A-37 threonylcarbamoyl transferase component Bud32
VTTFVKGGVRPNEVEMQRLAEASGACVPPVVSYDVARGELAMRRVAGMSVSNWFGEEDGDTPHEVYEKARGLHRQLVTAGISYPDITGYDLMLDETNGELTLVDFERSERAAPCEFMRRFLAGHDGWNPDFR